MTLRIGQPRRTGRDWLAPVEIRGLRGSGIRHIYGVDALQALMLALEFARISLTTVTPPLRWLDGAPGDLGLPRQVPWLGLLQLNARFDRLIDAAVRRWARARERTRQHRRRSVK